jgi:hypothetical protein
MIKLQRLEMFPCLLKIRPPKNLQIMPYVQKALYMLNVQTTEDRNVSLLP